MGDTVHDAVIVMARGYLWANPSLLEQGCQVPDMDLFRERMPRDFRHLVVGPIQVMAFQAFIWVPDGSQENFGMSRIADEWRARFLDLFDFTYEDGSSPFDVIELKFGDDLYGDGRAPSIYSHTYQRLLARARDEEN